MADRITDTGKELGTFITGIGALIGKLEALISVTAKVSGETEKAGIETENYGTAVGSADDPLIAIGQAIYLFIASLGAQVEAEKAAIGVLYKHSSAIVELGTGMRSLKGDMDKVTAALNLQAAQTKMSRDVIKSTNKDYQDFAARQRKLNEVTGTTTTTTNSYTTAIETLTKWQKKALRSEEALSAAHEITISDLDGAIAKFYKAGDAVRDYATAIQGDLLGGIDLGAAFTGQLDEAGKASGIGLVDAFNQQIEQAKWFGNVLTSIKNSGADATLIQAIASLGPETGGALGQQLIDDGLIPTMNDKWTAVQDVTAGLAMGLVPEFLIAGIASAQDMVTGLATQLKAEQKTLKKLGKNMAKPVGAAFKSRLAKDVAEAVRNVEAAGTAARAERVASATTAQQSLTDQAVATAISNVLRRGDARAGSAVQPVLT